MVRGQDPAMPDPETQQKMALLRDCGPLKAWSVVVTVLGDLCTEREDRVTGRLLTRLTARMGLSAQAVRVAVHRLRGDGWIDSERVGRQSQYRLSAQGWRQAQAVRPVIYPAAAPRREAPWMVIAPASMAAAEFAALLPPAAVGLGPRCALLAERPRGLPAEMLLAKARPGHIPGWLARELADAPLCDEYHRLASCAARVVIGAPPKDLLEATVLRLLVLHHWRRLRLRHGPLPDMLLREDWAGARARAAVAVALDRFPRPGLDALARQIGGDGQD